MKKEVEITDDEINEAIDKLYFCLCKEARNKAFVKFRNFVTMINTIRKNEN